MRNYIVLGLFTALCIFIGCLGGGSGGGLSGGSPIVVPSSSAIYGKVFFPKSSLYGSIPIIARDSTGLAMGSTRTDAYGNFSFSELAPGIYNLFASTGETEVQFFTGAQVIKDRPLEIPVKELVELEKAVIDRIDSTSVRITFTSSHDCSSQIEYGTSIGPFENISVNNSFKKNHQTTITGLTPGTRYSFTIKLLTQDGQQFSYPALYTTTSTAVGPTNISFNIENGSMVTTFNSVRLYIDADNATKMRFGTDENLDTQPWENFSNFKEFSLSGGDGTKRIYVQFQDSFGNVSSVVNDSIQLQTDRTGYIGVWINNGEGLTNERNVVLSLLFPGASQMQISTTPDFQNSFWEAYNVARKFSFSAEDGVKTIYVRFRGAQADENKTFSASIILDTTGPEVTMEINGGALKTNNINLTLSFTPVKTPSYMQLEEDGVFDENSTWVGFTNPYKFLISKEDGLKTVYAKFKDDLGNQFGPISAQIELDTSPPQNADFNINNGEQTSDSLEVRLYISADDASYIKVSNSDDFAGSEIERFKTIKNWSLAGYGVQTVYMQFIDNASNSTSALIQSIEVVGDPPASGAIVINQNDPSTDSATVSLTLASEEAVNVRVGNHQNFSSLTDIAYNDNLSGGGMRIDNFSIDPVAGTKTVYARFENSDGQFSVAFDTINLNGPTDYNLTTIDTLPLDSYSVNLRPYALGATEMMLTENQAELDMVSHWQTFNYSVAFKLNPFTGKHTIYAKYRNSSGIETPVLSLDVTVGDIPELTPTVTINEGDSQTEAANVQLTISNATDYPTMRISNDNNFFSSTDVAAVSQPWYLTRQEGEKTVYVRFKHKDTGEYYVASDTITAIGPKNTSITSKDTQPLNKNWVNLDLFAVGATDMIITEDADIANLTVGWVPYQTSMVFPLINSIGEHTVYAKFRNSATNYIESVPVSLQLMVNSTSPSGNNASLRETAAVGSLEISEVPIGSLPVYLHFDIQDVNTATISWQIASAGASIPTSFNRVSAPVAPIPLSSGDFSGNGTFNIYYKFADGVGNETGLQISSIKVLGPSLKISPATVAPLHSGQTQQFNATLENIEGTVRWYIDPNTPTTVYGAINPSTGLYTAPSTVNQNASFIVRAELLSDPTVNDTVNVKLETQVEIVVAQTNYQITKGDSTEITVRFKNSTATGTVVSPTPGGGTAILTDHPGPFIPATEVVASLSYTAPATPISDTVEIVSTQDPSKKKILYFTVNDGPWVTITPDTAKIRVKTGSTQFAADTSSSTGTLHWRLTKGGYFDPAKTQVTTTTTGNGNHNVTVYAPDTQAINPIELVASFTEGAIIPTDKATITLDSEVKVTVSPKNQKIYLAETTPLLFLAEVENATTSTVIWQYRNASETDWVTADNYTDEFNGILRLNQGESEYLPPATWPIRLGNGPTNKVEIRAVSIDDTSASDTTMVELIEPLQVKIYDGYNAQGTNITDSSISVTLEVGTRQLFAEVGPVTDPTTNTTVNWFVQNIAGGNTTYGTVDSTGKFIAPDTAPQAAVTVKAVSVAESSAFAETTINLLDFWTPRSTGLTNVTNATDSVFCLEIDPTSAAGTDRVIYCGTNGYGVFRTTIAPSGSDYSWNNVIWTGVPGLSTVLVGKGARYIVNQLSISKQNSDRAVAATNDGLYLITGGGTTWSSITIPNPRPAPTSVAATVTDYSGDFTNVFSSVVIDPTDEKYMYAVGKDQGVLRFTWTGANYTYHGTLYDDNQFYSTVTYFNDPWKVDTDMGTAVASRTYVTGAISRPVKVSPPLASGTMEFNCVAMTAQNPNVLYVGFTKYLETRDPDVFKVGYLKLSNIRTANYLYIGELDFVIGGDPIPSPYDTTSPNTIPLAPNTPGQYQTVDNWHFIGGSGIINFDTTGGIIQSIAIDPNTASTIWRGKNSGIERSTDDGSTFSSLGTYANVRDIFIDPINTVNVYIGTEAGLYRTKNAGSAWKQIKTGLEGNTTLNSLGLTPGGLGTRRIFLGTTNGIFMGRTSLDLE
jgi:hypothetical protein